MPMKPLKEEPDTHGIYVRVSTDDQATKGYSIPSQIEACRARVPAGQEALEFIDDGYSGSSLDRPALERLRTLARGAKEPVHVITYDPDRLSRNLVHLLLLTDEFGKNGSLTFVSMTWEATAEGRLFLSLRGAVAEFEREKIKERTTRGRLQKAKQGGISCVPQHVYGYDWNNETDDLTIKSDEAQVVREIFRDYVEGFGPYIISQRLNQRGIPTSMGNQWRPVTVSRMLKNHAYRGVLLQFRNSDNPIITQVPAIVDETTWAAAQAILEQRRRVPTGGSSQKAMLSGILRCGTCGSPMYTSVRGGTQSWYICRSKVAKASFPGTEPCGARNHRVDRLDAAVWADIVVLLRAPVEYWERLTGSSSQGEPSRKRLDGIREEIARLKKGRKNLLKLLASGALDADEVEEQLATDKARLASLEAQDRALSIAPKFDADAFATWVSERIAEFQSESCLDSELPMETKRRLVRSLLTEAVVSDDGTVVLGFP